MQRLLQKLFSNESPSDSEMLILRFLSIYIDISTQGGIDFPCCQKKRSVFTKVMLPSAMLWSGDQMYLFFFQRCWKDYYLLHTCAGFHALQLVLISSDFNLPNPALSVLRSSVLSPLPGPAWAERGVGAAGRRSPAPRHVFLLLERDCSLRAG